MVVLKNADFGVIFQNAKRLVLKEKQINPVTFPCFYF